MDIKELYLKTLFCCSACDGEIAPEEISLVKELSLNDEIFEGIDVEKILNSYIERINADGIDFLKNYLQEISNATLSEDEQLKLIELAIRMIEADNQVLYSEVKFFKRIKSNLTVSDDSILKVLPDAEEYLLPDLTRDSKTDDWGNISFTKISLSE